MFNLEMINSMMEPPADMIPEPEELEAIRAGREDRAVNGTIPHEAINWD